jgi:hypothetical protein
MQHWVTLHRLAVTIFPDHACLAVPCRAVPCLAWPGLGLAWLGLAWLGLACLALPGQAKTCPGIEQHQEQPTTSTTSLVLQAAA